MWKNFSDMPLLLKLITAYALSGILFLILSVSPFTSFTVNGEPATYSAYWLSGAGVQISLLGVFMVVAGVLLLQRKKYSRQLFLGVLSIALIEPYFRYGRYRYGLLGVICALMIGLYLFIRKPVKAYFDPGEPKRHNPERGASNSPP